MNQRMFLPGRGTPLEALKAEFRPQLTKASSRSTGILACAPHFGERQRAANFPHDLNSFLL